LLAHELVHSVQQRNHPHPPGSQLEVGPVDDAHEIEADHAASQSLGMSPLFRPAPHLHGAGRMSPLVQRQPLNCDLDPIKDECKGAAAKCQTVSDYCAKELPNPGDIDKKLAAIKALIDGSDFGPNAKKNFRHFLDGSGTELVMPSALFENHPSSKNALSDQRDKFIEGAKKRLADGRLVNGGTAEMRWTGHAEGFTASSLSDRTDDLAYAVGGYQLCSNVRVKATKLTGTKFKIEFLEWKSQAFDCYNWDPGKGIAIQGLSDKDMCCLENAKKAQHFMDRTDVWENKFADSKATFEVETSDATDTSGASSGSSGSGSGSSSSSKKESGR